MKNFWLIFNLIISLALWVAVGFCFVLQTNGIILYVLLQVLIYIAISAVALYLSFILHEVGHLFFGSICKMGVKINKFSFLSPSLSVWGFTEQEKDVRWRYFITVIGGLIFNLLLIVIGGVGLKVSALIWLCPFVPASFYVLFLNILPYEYESGKTDGLVANEVLNNKDTAKVLLVLLCVQGQINCGKKLEEIDENIILNLPQLPEDDINFIYLTQLRAMYYAAKGESEKSEKYQKRYEDLKIYL